MKSAARYGLYAIVGELLVTGFFLTTSGVQLAVALLLGAFTLVVTAILAALVNRRADLAVLFAAGLVLLWLGPMVYDLAASGEVYRWSDLAAPVPLLVALLGLAWFLARRRRA